VKLDWVQRLVAGYSSKFADISKWRQSSVENARANKQVRTKIARIIHIPDNATETSLFCLPIQANGEDTSNWPCTAFLVRCMELTHVLFILSTTR
jgi:hypothetical protein